MKENTLYEILQVSENASDEIIEKAYKTLAKKYHPDLQIAAEKYNAEQMMKKINEAYDTLGNKEKRMAYDNELRLKRERQKEKEINNYTNNATYNTNKINQENVNDGLNYEKEQIKFKQKLEKEEAKQRKAMQEKLNQEYQNAYYNYLKDLGYKVKKRWTKENLKDIFFIILIMIGIIAALWFFPPTHDWMVNFYEENTILQTIVDIIVAIVTGIFKGIWSFITGLFS